MTMATSPDGGNLIAVFRRSGAAQSVGELNDNYARVLAAVRAHSPARYYCSRSPYAGIAGRLRAYLTDRVAARRGATPRQVLDALVERSQAGE